MSYSKPETAPRLSDLFSLQGKTALVIGGAGLLGSEISHAFAEQGANVIIASRSLEKCQNYTNYLTENFKIAFLLLYP